MSDFCVYLTGVVDRLLQTWDMKRPSLHLKDDIFLYL